jgi:amino acid adenylation domain-containing protein/non-ribosomal peptide synthase protein (TIGR01720 family)
MINRNILEKRRIAANQNKKAREYWLSKLSGEWTKAMFPHDNNLKQGDDDKNRLGTREFRLAGEDYSRMMQLSNQSDFRLHMILVAGVVLLLDKYTGSSDIIVGAPIYKQPGEGEFINTLLPLRHVLHEGMTFKELLLQVRQTIGEAVQYQSYPMEILSEQLDMAFSEEDFPFFDCAILLENIHDKKYLYTIRPGVIFSFYRTGEYITGMVEYRSLLYREEMMKQVTDHLTHIFQSVLPDVEWELSRIDILSSAEKKQLLVDFNQTDAAYPEDATIHRLFEEQVKRTSDRLALVYPDPGAQDAEHDVLTYRELNERANQLAYQLRKKGVNPGAIVAMLMEPSLEMVIGILGILKAGGAYLPIDPDYPLERINYMLTDSGAKILVTTPVLPGKFEKLLIVNCQLLIINEKTLDRRRLNNPPKETNNNLQLKGNSLAYIIYTSGSTGVPKGVPVEHRGAVNILAALQLKYPLLESDAYLLKTSYLFDVSITELFGWFWQGGRLVVIEPVDQKDPLKILDAIKQYHITHINFVPSMFAVFLEFLEQKGSHGTGKLKYIFLAGELLPPELVRRFQRLETGIPLENLYGPTESTIYASGYSISQWTGTGSVPIGKPLANIKLYILNKYHQSQPVGVSGELCISGIGLARGYLNRPELTAEKFDHDLWDYQDYHDEINEKLLWGVQGGGFLEKSPPGRRRQKIYKSGDQGRWLESGDLEYLGRIDQQVKIRGFRIEPGEIENRILGHSGVKEVLVIAREGHSGQKYLCAYIVPHVPGAFELQELRDYVQRALPGYMVPAYFVLLEGLPLTPNGKIDRQALPDPAETNIKSESAYAAPRNVVEEKLKEIWEQVLGRKDIGTNDSFFMLGGDSIKSIQIAARVRKVGYTFEMKDIFLYPTISKLAGRVKKLKQIADQSVITGPMSLSPIQVWFFQQDKRYPFHYNQAVMLYSSEGFEIENLRAIFTKIQAHHDILRTTFAKDEAGETRAFIHDLGYPLYLQEYDLADSTDKKETMTGFAALVNDIQVSLDLEKGPLMKLGVFHLEDGDRLLIVIHHLVIDTVSWRILFEDMETLNQQYKKGEPLELPLKTDSYKLWAEKLYDYANSKDFLNEKNYWAQLEAIKIPGITRDLQDEPGSNYQGDKQVFSFELSKEETELLLTKVNHAFGTEINDILLTALALGFKKTFGKNKLLIALEGHGREDILKDMDISRTVGWFSSIYPVVMDVSYENDLARQVKEIKEILHQVPHKGIGYGILRYLTAQENKEEIEFQLEPQTSFNYLGQFDAEAGQMTSFQFAGESSGRTQNLKEKRDYDFEVTGLLANEVLRMSIAYNSKHYKSITIEEWAYNYKTQLQGIISFCAQQEKRGYTPSDFTYKGLSIETIDALSAEIDGEIEDIYTLSPLQEGMLFHALYDSDSSTYFEQISYRLSGEFDVHLLEKSLTELFKRHDILRTVFMHKGDERPIQVVLKERPVDFYYMDLRPMPGQEEKETFLNVFREEDRTLRTFNLSQDVLMRLAVIQLETNLYEFIWSHHHILMDGWCMGILISEFLEIYGSYLENRPYQLSDPPRYRWYIQWLERVNKEASRRYWAGYLEYYDEAAGIPGTLPLDLSTGSDYKNDQVFYQLDAGKAVRLIGLIGKHQVTLNTLIQVVWGIILAKYNNTQDVVFGAVVSGRPHDLEGVETMVGLFINTIPVRIRFDEKTTFNELIQKVQQEAVESEPHHYYPLAEIQAQSALGQHLLNHIMIFENYPIQENLEEILEEKDGEKPGLKFELSHVISFEQTNYAFNIMVGALDRIVIKFLYNGNLYERKFIETFAGSFGKLFGQILENENLEVKKLTLLSPEEKQRILEDFNRTAAEYSRENYIHRLFEEQAQKKPDHIALVGKEWFDQPNRPGHWVCLTYREFNRRADQLAWILKDKGVSPGTIVSLKVERSIHMVVGIYGILKTGGAYLPIDPGYPRERVEYLLRDSVSPLLLSQAPFTDGRYDNICQVVDLADPCLYTGPEKEVRDMEGTAEVGYVLYTSGSTGQPKGVVVEHRSIVNVIFGLFEAYPFSGSDNYLLKTSYVFDVSVSEFFGWFLGAGRLSVLEKGAEKDPHEILNTIARLGVTHVNFVPSMFNAFVDTISAENIASLWSLKYIFLAGEALPPQLVNKFKTLNREVKLENIYGPTEATVYAAKYSLQDWNGRYNIPIGKPLRNMKLYILDHQGNLQAIGVPGELYISGIGVARGYLNNPELTFEKFVDFNRSNRSYKSDNSNRIYKTGDLARWLPDEEMNVEFLGRRDHQVKIRGFRVELGEIENQLLQFKDIKEAVVVDRKSGDSDTLLCAYIVSDKELKVTELMNTLESKLPGYMIPAYFVQLERIPLTTSGKVDRRALPEPQLKSGAVYTAPRSEMEQKLVRLFAEVLNLEEEVIGIDHNFFQLGGHSLKGIQLLARIHKEMNVRLRLAEMLKKPTVRDISLLIRQGEKEQYASLEPVEKKEYYQLSSAQERLYVLHQVDDTGIAYNMPLVITLRTDIEEKKLEEVFKKLIHRHESFRTSLKMIDGQLFQRVHEEVEFKIEYKKVEVEVKVEEERPPLFEGTRGLAPLSNESTARTPQAAALISSFIRPFDLTRAPLLRVGLIHIGQDKHLLIIDMHHIISDASSLDLLARDFLILYGGGELSGLRLQYRDYSQWQKSEEASTRIKQQEQYWLQRFAGALPEAYLPSDYPRPQVRSLKADQMAVEIDGELTGKIREAADRAEVTLHIFLLAVYSVLLSIYTRQEDIVVGTAAAGRTHADLQQIIGMFINMLPLRNQPQPHKTFAEFLEEVKINAFNAYENQDYQFEELVNQLGIKKELSQTPLFDTVFQFVGTASGGRSETRQSFAEVSHSGAYKFARYDVMIEALEFTPIIKVIFTYSTALYKKTTIETLSRRFIEVLGQVVDNPGIRLGEISVSHMLLRAGKDNEALEINFGF